MPQNLEAESESDGNESAPKSPRIKFTRPPEIQERRYLHLKLYAEEDSGPKSSKKPVVVETYNEIVFPVPPADFLTRVQNHPAIVVPRLPATFNSLPEADVLLKLAAACQQVQGHIIKLRKTIEQD